MEQRSVLRINEYLATVTSVLSFFGTLFIMISFFAWKDIRTTSRRILVYISAADFCTSVATIAAITSIWISGSESKQVCLVQSILGTLSVLCSFFWTVFMALYLYITVCKKNARLAEKLMFCFHVCGWGIPIIIVSVAVSLKKLGNNGDQVTSGWCWVNQNLHWKDQVLWMLLAGKFWEIMAYFVIVVLYALLKRNMTKEIHQKGGLLTRSTVVQAQRAERKLMCVPLIFVFFRIWGTIRFLLLVARGPGSHEESHDWLLILQGIGDNAPGFANFLLFCFFTDKCLGHFQWWFRSCTSCFTRNIHRSNSLTVYCDEVTPQEPLINQWSEMSNEKNCQHFTVPVKNYSSILNS